jgi:hypothetical protein
MGLFTLLSMKMEQIECSETSAYKIQTPGNHPEENIQHTEHGEGSYLLSNEIMCITDEQPFGHDSQINSKNICRSQYK